MNKVTVTITLGDAADIYLMIEQQLMKIDDELKRITTSDEMAITKLLNRKKSFKALQEKFNI